MMNRVDTPSVRAQVLIVDDEPDHAEVMAEALRKPGHVCTIVHNLEQARDELLHGNFDVIVTDLVMDHETAGLDVLKLAKEQQLEAETIMVTAHGDVPTAKAALQGGAYDFIEKPLDLDVFRNLVNRAAETVVLRHQNTGLRGKLDAAYGFEGIIGDSPAIRQIIATVKQVGPSNIAVLITGESGVGKELIAAAIHKHSKRANKRYVTFNAAGQSETLLEDQLFGHVRGAYTGADRDREGVFEYADGGTLFLDEVGDMPLPMQSKLLRVLETGEVVRLGANEPRRTDVRFVSATNREMKKAVAAGQFREDLYFRIRGAEINVPPLRERREDIPKLVNHALGKYAADMERPIPSLTDAAMMRLVAYSWPGNVRELLNVVQKMVVMTAPSALGSRLSADRGQPTAGSREPTTVIDVRDVPAEIRTGDADAPSIGSLAGVGLDKLEKEAIRQTLAMTHGNREQAANMLGIGERTLYRKLKEYGLR
jgi:DNA-binding NtrC family response regulator